MRAVKTAPEFEFPTERKALTVTSRGLSAKGPESPCYGWQLANQGSRGPKGPRDQGPSRVFSAFSCSHTESECHIEMLSNSHMVMRRKRAEGSQEKLPNLKRSTCWLNLALYRRDFNSNLFSLLCSVWYWPFFVLKHFSWTPLIECCPIWHKGKEFVRSHNGSFLC